MLIVGRDAMEGIMAKKTDNEENFKRYQERLAELQREGNLIPPPDLPTAELISFLAAEGEKLLGTEKTVGRVKPKIVDERKKLDATLSLSSKNPYVRARIVILQKLPAWRRNEIAEMEKTGNIDNKFYEEFVHEVAILGDKLSGE